MSDNGSDIRESKTDNWRQSGYLKNSPARSPHTFHIPVMGTGFTVDTPLKVARFGISSVVSIGDDFLLENMRRYHSEHNGLKFVAIPDSENDSRARRITAYLDLLHDLIQRQTAKLQGEPFEPDYEITRYFEMLPDSNTREDYFKMLLMADSDEKRRLQDELRMQAVPGSIDVNIMTKVDWDRFRDGIKLPPEESVAMSALRGFAQSKLQSSIVLSAGLNRRLFSYMAEFDDFFPNEKGCLKKKIILKVSDYRSALVQGKMLASMGLWVSEYRIESGVNCGGHAFTAKGYLMGPILEEFKRNRTSLVKELHARCTKALSARRCQGSRHPLETRITVQGGIGNAEENRFLMKYYEVDGTGWGTPFLLVPEATNVDPIHLEKLAAASDKDVHLSDGSPLGVPFWSLRTSASEETRRQRILADRPGSPCPRGFLGHDTEFTETPICHASRQYQKLKLKQISDNGTAPELLAALKENVVSKSCLCLDLAAGALIKTGLDLNAKSAICSGPSIVNFKEIVSLDTMIGHIYGRISIIKNSNRPHFFIKEIDLYIAYLRQELEKTSIGLINRSSKYFAEFQQNLTEGMEYYRELANHFGRKQQKKFLKELEYLAREIERLLPDASAPFAIEGAA